jgi:hypothetical protein
LKRLPEVRIVVGGLRREVFVERFGHGDADAGAQDREAVRQERARPAA